MKENKKRYLITGATGFVGSHMAELLLKESDQVYAAIKHRSPMDNIKHLKDKLKFVELDLLDSNNVRNVVKAIKPDYIFHLGAISYVLSSWATPESTCNVNFLGTLRLLDAVRKEAPNAKIQVASSSETYGLVYPNETPIKETNPLRPSSPYGVSKVAMDLLAQQYHRSYGLSVVITRGFNHSGPRRGEVFATSNFAKQIAQIENGTQDKVIKVGNMDAVRDFTDVRDMVKAYRLSVDHCKPGEAYNVCSGKGYKISDVANILMGYSDVKNIKLEKDPSRMRPSDVPLLIGDSSRFRAATGWQPEIEFEKTLADLLNYWREKIKSI